MNFRAGKEKDFFKFISSLDEKDKIGLVSHTDLDGICSASIVAKVLDPDKVELINYDYEKLENVIKEMRGKEINKIVFTDINFNGKEKIIEDLNKFEDVLIIDHHEFSKDINSNKIHFFNTESDIPASYCSHYLFSKVREIPRFIPALGIIADLPHLYNKDNGNEVFRDFNLGEKEEGSEIDIREESVRMGRALIYVKSGENSGPDLKDIYESFVDAENTGDLEELHKYGEEVGKEIEDKLDEYKEEKEVEGGLVIFEFESRFFIKGAIINEVSTKEENKGKIFVFLREDEGKVNVSVRSQEKRVDSPNLLKEALKGIPKSDSGGHKAAAGAILPKEYKDKFKENLKEVYRNLD